VVEDERCGGNKDVDGRDKPGHDNNVVPAKAGIHTP